MEILFIYYPIYNDFPLFFFTLKKITRKIKNDLIIVLTRTSFLSKKAFYTNTPTALPKKCIQIFKKKTCNLKTNTFLDSLRI